MENLNESKCPFNKKGMFSFFNRANEMNETMDTERGSTALTINNYKDVQTETKKESPSKCPVKHDPENSDEEENQTGGCPVKNKIKKDPPNKHFEPHYEIPRYGAFDFLFQMRGTLEMEEWLEKAKKMISYPRHMKYTLLFQNQEKLKQVHTKEFPMVFFCYDDIKEKGNRLYKRKKFREAIDSYTYAYGLLKWIEFKDPKKQEEFLKKPSLDPILDEDILEKHVYLDDVAVEEDSYKACVVFNLMNLAYANMELRHYSTAIECLDECIPIANDKVPDLYFRRSQARTYNKFSEGEELDQALKDIDKAIQLKDDPMYKEHKEILLKIIEEKINKKKEKTKTIMDKAHKKFTRVKNEDKEKERDKDIICHEIKRNKERNKDALKQYKILKEMKSKYNLAVKFFTETKNEEQLVLTYKEIEAFYESFLQFQFFFEFSLDQLPEEIYNMLTPEERELIKDPEFAAIFDEIKFRMCEDIFGEGDYNFELFQYCLERVFEEDRKREEEEEKRQKEEKGIEEESSWFNISRTLGEIPKSRFSKYLSAGLVLFSVGALAGHYYMYSSSLSSFFG